MKKKKLFHLSRIGTFKFWLLFRAVSICSVRMSLNEKNPEQMDNRLNLNFSFQTTLLTEELCALLCNDAVCCD